MFSKEFMKFLYSYQKDEFKPKNEPSKEIYFTGGGSGKLADIKIPVENRK